MSAQPLVEIDGLQHRYPGGHVALHGVSLRVLPGERVALVGPNGAGKSTLLLHLNGVLQPTAGSVQVAGLPVRDGHLAEVRATVGLLFQNPVDQVFAPTVAEDVAYGPLHMGLPRDEVAQRVRAALAQAGLPADDQRLTTRLSLGELKRVALAGVLAMSPQLLVLDEPTAGLDPRGAQQLLDLLTTMPQTLLISTHDLHFAARLATRLVLMDGGRIVGDGPLDALLPTAWALFGLAPPTPPGDIPK